MAAPYIRVSVDGRKFNAALRRTRTAVSPASLDISMRGVAKSTLDYAKKKTPKRLTGKVRNTWKMRQISLGVYRVENNSKFYKFIDKGAKAHRARKSRVMVLLLSRRALKAGVRGVLSSRKKFQYRKDYAIARKVRRIKAQRITEKVRAYSEPVVLATFSRHMRKGLY